MSVYRDVIEAVLRMVNDIGLYAPATIGPLPPDNGISIAWGSGSQDNKNGTAMAA